MRVRILISIAGELFAYDAGQIADVEDDLARKWLRSGVAGVLDDAPETATVDVGPERPTRTRSRRRARAARC